MVGNTYLSILATFATPPIVLPPKFSVPLTTGLAPYLYTCCNTFPTNGNPPPINVPSFAYLILFLAVANANLLPVSPSVDSGALILPALISVKGILYSIPYSILGSDPDLTATSDKPSILASLTIL